jgi:hypothetical protein
MPEKPGEKFGDLLVKAGLIDEMQLQAALGHQRRWGGKFGQCVVDLGFITESELLQFMSDKFKIPAIDLTKSRISDQAFASVPESVAKKYGVVPVFLKEGPGKKKTLTLAMSDPTNLKVLDEVQFLTGFKAEPVLANESAISRVLEQYGHYDPIESGGTKSRAGEFARPADLRKEHSPAPAPVPQPPTQETPEPSPEVELVLGGEEPTEGMPEIMDLEEAESEGVEISPDEDVQVIKDEVVMVRADAPRPKTKVGSSTERVPSRAPIREKVGKVPKVESYSPPPGPPPKPESDKEFLRVPDVGIEPAATDQSQPGTEPAAATTPQQEISIDLPKGGEDEKLDIAPAHEFVSWQQAPAKEAAPAQPESEPGPVPAEPADLPAFQEEPQTQAGDQKLTRMVKPETAEDDFWADHDQEQAQTPPPTPPPLEDEEPLPFEKVIEPEIPAAPPVKEMADEAPEEKPVPAGLGTVESFTETSEDIFEKPLPVGIENNEAHIETDKIFGPETDENPVSSAETAEMSLEFAFKKITDLESEVQRREFQFDELLSLMMKKELGEITTELFMQELVTLKQEMEKKKSLKK